MNTIVHYFSGETDQDTTSHARALVPSVALQQLRAYFAEGSIELVDVRAAASGDDIRYLLLIEAYQVGKAYYAISLLWNTWLRVNYPKVHLLVGCFNATKHPNFFNLSALPSDFPQWLQQTKAAKAFKIDFVRPEPNEEESTAKNDITSTLLDGRRLRRIDDWELLLPKSGERLDRLMENFIRGHDEENSVKMAMLGLSAGLQQLRLYQDQDEVEAYKQQYRVCKQRWNGFYNRWYQYRPLFSLLPFGQHIGNGKVNQIEELDEIIAQLQTVIKRLRKGGEQLAKSLTLVSKLTQHMRNLATYLEP